MNRTRYTCSLLLFGVLLLLAGNSPMTAQVQADSKKDAKKAIEQFEKDLQNAKKASDIISAVNSLTTVKHRMITETLIDTAKRFRNKEDLVSDILSEIGDYGDPWATEELQRFPSYFKNKPDAYEALMKAISDLEDHRRQPLLLKTVKISNHKFLGACKESAKGLKKLESWSAVEPISTFLVRLKSAYENAKEQRKNAGTGSGSGGTGSGGGTPGGTGSSSGGSGTTSNKQYQRTITRYNTIAPILKETLQRTTGESFDKEKEWSQWVKKNQRKIRKKTRKQKKEFNEDLQKRLDSWTK